MFDPSENVMLVDADFLGRRHCRLGDDNGQDAVLQTGANFILVDPGGEVERALEFASGALGKPVLECRCLVRS